METRSKVGRIEVHPGSFRKSVQGKSLEHTENERVRKVLKTNEGKASGE